MKAPIERNLLKEIKKGFLANSVLRNIFSVKKNQFIWILMIREKTFRESDF